MQIYLYYACPAETQQDEYEEVQKWLMNTENTKLKGLNQGFLKKDLFFNFEFSGLIATPFITNANKHGIEIKKKKKKLKKGWEGKCSI